VPDEVVDALVVHGAPERCRELVAEYATAGVTTPVLAVLPTPEWADGPDRLARITDVVARLGPGV
jgi:hypothetical protein